MILGRINMSSVKRTRGPPIEGALSPTHGDISDVETAESFAAQVLGAQIETLPGVDHNVPERAGSKFTNLLRQFLDTTLRSDSNRASTSLLP